MEAKYTTPNFEIETLELLKSIIENKVIELVLEDGNVISCDEVIPVNIDPGSNYRSINERITELIKKIE